MENGKNGNELGIIGLGKMGMGIALHAREKGWRVVAHDRSPEKNEEFARSGGEGAASLRELATSLSAPRIVWSMLPAGEPTEEAFFGAGGVAEVLEPGDIVIDAANAFYEDTLRRRKLFDKKGVRLVDVGYSGGPSSIQSGGAIMAGGAKEDVDALAALFTDMAIPNGWLHCGPSGAGHFVKMVHNGIEYGMMQSLAEGFAVLKAAPYPLNLTAVADVYNHRSIIESRLVGWLKDGFAAYGEDLADISGSVAQTDEGKWTVETAKKFGVPTPSIELAYQFRIDSETNPSFIGKILSTLRNQFGGHAVR